jgi:epoxyqueuosine reductase QueG
VITDLPLAVGAPIDFGVTEFCNQCTKCAKLCPIGAIPFGDRSFESATEASHRGVLQWQLDHKKCAEYSAKVGTNCGICIRVCPFNKGRGKIHDVSRWFINNFRFLNPLFVKLDDVLGYGKFRSPEKFWLKD